MEQSCGRGFFFVFFFFFGAGIESRASRILGKRCTTKLHPSPVLWNGVVNLHSTTSLMPSAPTCGLGCYLSLVSAAELIEWLLIGRDFPMLPGD
jgi:hypothetical protein